MGSSIENDDHYNIYYVTPDPKVLVSGRIFTSTTETSPQTLYISDIPLSRGYIYGVQLLASSEGTVDFEVCIFLVVDVYCLDLHVKKSKKFFQILAQYANIKYLNIN